MRRTLPRLCLAAVALCLAATSARASVIDYVKTPDKEFRWQLKEKTETDVGTVYDLHLVSQVWQGIKWEHQLQVYLPKGVKPGATMFLYNQGGRSSAGAVLFGMDLAKKMNAPVAFLFGVPNQPLLGNLREDALIAETFVRYLNTKDANWPLLFPMTKSLVRAMDALQEFARKEWKVEVTSFVVSGGSKRGWTSWLTAASDARVKAVAPLVIDTLNMHAQMEHQLKSYGKYSEMIRDYTKAKLVPMPKTEEAVKLWKMVDPYFYRDKIKIPQMIINGANDPYWTVDALNLYWDGLHDKKWVLYVPNAGHGLDQKVAGKSDRSRAMNTLAAFARSQIHGTAMPKLTWKHDDNGGMLRLSVTSDVPPKGARLWVVEAPTKDFRKMTWAEWAAKVERGTVVGEVPSPGKGYLAFFAELDFADGDLRYSLSTQIRVAGKGER